MITVFLKNDPSHTPVISSGGSMLSDYVDKNRYSFDESRNLSCGREYWASGAAKSRPGIKRRRFLICAPPHPPWPKAITLEPLRPQGVTPQHLLSAVSVVTPSQAFTWEISRLFLTYDFCRYSHSDAYLHSK